MSDPLSFGNPPGALDALGWNARLDQQFEPLDAAGLLAGRVARVDRGAALVITERGQLRAAPSSALLRSAASAEALPATGDWVAVRVTADGSLALIEAVLPRSSAFRRFRADRDPVTGAVGGGAQVLAANVDTVFIVIAAGVGPEASLSARNRAALQPDGRVRRLDRELALAFESGARPVIVLSKGDLCADRDAAVAQVTRVAAGVPVHATTGATGEGIDELRRYAADNATIALIGASGVGKSTIANRLVGDEVLATSAVRAGDARGRHTTTARHLVLLPRGGTLIDTPGLRSLGLWEAEDAVGRVYADVEALANACRFRDCRHEQEPGCAVRAAIEEGALADVRLDAYRKLAREAALEERKRDPRLQAAEHAERQAFGRGLRKQGRQRAKSRWRDE